MNEIDIINDYITDKTDYAIMLKGKWGSGKTYFYRNIVLEDIKTKNPDLNFVYISLFGITSIEEIQTQIFLSIYSMIKEKKITNRLFKLIAKGAFKITQLGNIEEYIKEIQDDAIDLKKIFICFDDVERRSSHLELKALIGYINAFVDNNGAKVLLLANRDKIDSEEMNKLEEKLIQIKINYEPSVDRIEDIISYFFSDFETYKSFLLKNKSLLLNYLEIIEHNFRSLIFGLQKFAKAYSKIELNYISKKDKEIINSVYPELLYITLVLAEEYRQGRIDIENADLKSTHPILSSYEVFDLTIKPDEKEKSYRDDFNHKYFDGTSMGKTFGYKYFSSIYNLVVEHKTFDDKQFKEEFIDNYQYYYHKEEPQYKILNELRTDEYLTRKTSDYRRAVSKMLYYAEDGKYKLAEYTEVFILAIKFDNVLSLSLKSLRNRLLRGIRKSAKYNELNTIGFQPKNSIGFKLKDEYLSIYNELDSTIDKIRNQFLLNENKKSLESIVSYALNEWDNFLDKYLAKPGYRHQPFFSAAKPHKVYLFLNNASPKVLNEFNYYLLTERYKRPEEYLINEKAFIDQLLLKLEPKSLNRKKKTIKNYFLDKIYFNLQEISSRLSKARS